MRAVLVNYRYEPTWLSEYPDLEPIIYDRSDDGEARDLTIYGSVYKTQNMGDVDYDKLGFLVEHYDNLPDVFVWGKTNLLKYVSKEYFDDALLKSDFAPLLKLDHRIYSDNLGPVNKYQGGIYYERADSWFFHNPDLSHKYFRNWEEWASRFGLPLEGFIPFAPGGNYILTRERVHRYGRDFYEEMRATLDYAMHPAEAHACERSYYYIWR